MSLRHVSFKSSSAEDLGSRRASHDLFHDLTTAKAILADNMYRDNPLLPELQFMADRYIKLAKRFDRIIKISDTYQADLWNAYQKLELAARTDDLTGLFNRRDMMSRLTVKVKEAASRDNVDNSTGTYLLLIDIDRFKDINDRFGHAAGDMALIELAKLMQTQIGSQGVVARWGGEEFLILSHQGDDGSALAEAEALRLLIASKRLSAGDGIAFSTTVSIGISRLAAGMTIDGWLHSADVMLYEAKRHGRNRCCLVC